jgi:hypothetical protein
MGYYGCVADALVGCAVVQLGVEVGAEGKLTRSGFTEPHWQITVGTAFRPMHLDGSVSPLSMTGVYSRYIQL